MLGPARQSNRSNTSLWVSEGTFELLFSVSLNSRFKFATLLHSAQWKTYRPHLDVLQIPDVFAVDVVLQYPHDVLFRLRNTNQCASMEIPLSGIVTLRDLVQESTLFFA